MSQRSLHVAQILWPAFIVAGLIEMVVFAWVDPSALSFGSLQLGSQAVYTLAFFLFWALVAVSALLSHWMMQAGSTGKDSSAELDSSPTGAARTARGASRRTHQRRQRQHARSMA
ncbi:MAG: hypothetical protein KGI91_05935 [Burkholderiales bacterium]|nr:hypothetical protein [Burkholderiales bacterium]MDE2076605.1 hypothetical protein [Burkholderiales bacterium]MDE2432177.1 hypothetical protein [Burkholderiales bacterium]